MRQLVIGVDYGTSNSGVAYSIFQDEDNLSADGVYISVIKDLTRNASGQDAGDKIPSDITYDKDWQPIEFANRTSPEALQWVKLLLEPNGLRGKRNTQRVWKTYERLPSTKRPEDVVADYLEFLWSRTKACITSKFDEKDLFDNVNVTVILTVPASWSERAKQCMMKAAAKAGITDQAHAVQLVPEADAAAIAGLRWHAQQAAISEEDCVIVVDAGGGTVDVVAYKILSRHPLAIDQVSEGRGAFCGSVFIDLEFQNQLRSILGAQYDELSPGALIAIEDTFEHKIKRIYSPEDLEEGRRFMIPLPGSREIEIDDSVVDQCFQTIMTPIEALIDNQMRQLEKKQLHQKLKGILLVGGLGKSDFLYSRIRQGYGDLKVWQAADPWSAVAQGAVYCETSNVVHSRLSKHNYGIPYLVRDSAGSSKRQIHWIVKKGEPVQSNMPTEPYALRVEDHPWLETDEYFHLFVTLVRSDEDDVSEAFNDRRVKPHAVVDCRVPSALRHSEHAILVQDDPKVWHLKSTIVPVLDGAVISFRCKVGEEPIGITELDYFDDEGSPDQDFHPQTDPDAMSIARAPTRTNAADKGDDFKLIPTYSSNGRQMERKIRDYHFNTRTARDTPPKNRPKPGTLPGMFARGWIPREDFYIDYDLEG